MSAHVSFLYLSSCNLCLLVLLAFFHFCLCNQNHDDVLCMDGERQTLLQFKHGLIDEAGRLASWSSEESDCCKWAGITCDNFTGHVHGIHLRALEGHCGYADYGPYKDYDEASNQMLKGDLSSSLLHLKQLRHLDLSCNDFGGNQVPEFIGSLKNLRYLNLSQSSFGGIIPPHLGNLSNLHVLCLGSFRDMYQSTSMMNIQWLSSLRRLHHLDLSGVDLSKVIDWLQVINTLPSLVKVYMSNSQMLHVHPHVVSLNLTSLSLLDISYNNFNSSLPNWMFSITSLVSLDISMCTFHGPIPSNTGFRNLTNLKFLRVSGTDFMSSPLVFKGLSSIGGNLISLDMSYCGISSSVLYSLHNLTSLLSLDLSNNQLTKKIPKSLGNLCNLNDIDLSRNDFSNISLTNLLESLLECKFPRLKSLSIYSSRLSGHLPNQVEQLIHVAYLLLYNNRITGIIPDSIGQLSFLRTLDLSLNFIYGPIPDSIGQLSSLVVLDISKNQVNGTFPDSFIHLSKLEELYISNNLLTGVVTEAHFAKLVSLKYLDGRHNNLTLRASVAYWTPPFHMQKLYLTSWNLGPQFPSWLQLLTELRELDISNTHVSSCVPDSFLRSFPNLTYLDMSHNHIHGTLLGIPATLETLDLSSNEFRGNLPNLSKSLLQFLDLSDNHFEGPLPQKFNVSRLNDLYVSNNQLSGSIDQFLCPRFKDASWLIVLDLSNNNFSGVIPNCWLNLGMLYVISFENNFLSGGIPQSMENLFSLEIFNIRGNKLSGKIPASLLNLKHLLVIELAENEFTGSIPSLIGKDETNLKVLSLRSNKLEGEIPEGLCHLTSIQILDLAHNNLSGTVPTCFYNFSIISFKQNMSGLMGYGGRDKVQVVSLVTKGREYEFSTTLFLVTTLDLSCNKFTGLIPEELMDLVGLHWLNLSGNYLTGRIPDKIGKMTSLESLDLSFNQLDGSIPLSISKLNTLSFLNLSFNKLTGKIPASTQLQSLNESSFIGNTLCGPPLLERCEKKVVPPDASTRHGGEEPKDDESDWGFIISVLLGFVISFWAAVASLIVSKVWRDAYFFFLYKVWFKIRIACNL